MNGKFTLKQFKQRFPDDNACFEEIKRQVFGDVLACPKCQRENKFYRVAGRSAYACSFCGHHIYPLKGTIFDHSSTPLTDWFYAMYLMVQTRAGISAKQLERELGVTYKTAFRIFHQIRKLMADDGDMLVGDVEADETYLQPKPERNSRVMNKAKKHGAYNAQVVFGVAERGGRVRATHVIANGSRILLPAIQKAVAPGSTISSDGWMAYKKLNKLGYVHKAIDHSLGERIGTQQIENFWSNFKRGLYGVYRHCEPKYLQSYVDEYGFRYSNRSLEAEKVFNLLLTRI